MAQRPAVGVVEDLLAAVVASRGKDFHTRFDRSVSASRRTSLVTGQYARYTASSPPDSAALPRATYERVDSSQCITIAATAPARGAHADTSGYARVDGDKHPLQAAPFRRHGNSLRGPAAAHALNCAFSPDDDDAPGGQGGPGPRGTRVNSMPAGLPRPRLSVSPDADLLRAISPDDGVQELTSLGQLREVSRMSSELQLPINTFIPFAPSPIRPCPRLAAVCEDVTATTAATATATTTTVTTAATAPETATATLARPSAEVTRPPVEVTRPPVEGGYVRLGRQSAQSLPSARSSFGAQDGARPAGPRRTSRASRASRVSRVSQVSRDTTPSPPHARLSALPSPPTSPAANPPGIPPLSPPGARPSAGATIPTPTADVPGASTARVAAAFSPYARRSEFMPRPLTVVGAWTDTPDMTVV